MCGILGLISQSADEARDKAAASRMLSAIAHRGPDDSGVVWTPEITLGFARLSIIDTTQGSHQPMWSEDRSVCIVFNGEIYNFNELRGELKKKGRTFRTAGDTEVIVNSYLEYGDKCFEKFEGMFAIGIYDFKNSRLLLARDRMGKKPLYYCRSGGSFAFASELKALMLYPAHKKEVDVESLSLYLRYDYVPTPRTILKDVYKLEPGTFLVCEKGALTHKTFWKLDPKPFSGTFEEAVEKLDQTIGSAVKERLVADVPLGVFLSGGLDSSTVAYYAQKYTSEKIKTFSVAFDDTSFDESRYARLAADFLETEHHEETMKTSDLLEVVKNLGRLVDEPLADASIVPTFLLSKFTKKHVTVALGGDGADELFAGYPTFLAARYATLLNRAPHFIKSSLKALADTLPVSHANFSLGFKARKFFEANTEEPSHAHQMWLGTFGARERCELLLPAHQQKLSYTDEFSFVDAYFNEPKMMSDENRILYTYLRTYLMDGVMAKVDRASMFASLEARSPLLDRRLVEFAFSLPYEWKMKGGQTKHILKRLMETKLPTGIVHRAKKGFGMPIGSWMKGELRGMVEETLGRQRIENGGFFNADYVERLKAEHMRGKADHRKKLWNLLVFELWREASML